MANATANASDPQCLPFSFTRISSPSLEQDLFLTSNCRESIGRTVLNIAILGMSGVSLVAALAAIWTQLRRRGGFKQLTSYPTAWILLWSLLIPISVLATYLLLAFPGAVWLAPSAWYLAAEAATSMSTAMILAMLRVTGDEYLRTDSAIKSEQERTGINVGTQNAQLGRSRTPSNFSINSSRVPYLFVLRNKYRTIVLSVRYTTSFLGAITMNLSSYYYYNRNRQAQVIAMSAGFLNYAVAAYLLSWLHVRYGRRIIQIVRETQENLKLLKSSIADSRALGGGTIVAVIGNASTISANPSSATSSAPTVAPTAAATEPKPEPKIATAEPVTNTPSRGEDLSDMANKLFFTASFVAMASSNIGTYNSALVIWGLLTLNTEAGCAGVSYATGLTN
ncbi:hypothetical protein HK102_001155 [Quaeritorhiza haematococci]|nr:hypothetical protein HK102_001155 [Quaeritorhiza haematococci]